MKVKRSCMEVMEDSAVFLCHKVASELSKKSIRKMLRKTERFGRKRNMQRKSRKELNLQYICNYAKLPRPNGRAEMLHVR